jgi:hypothetical protein
MLGDDRSTKGIETEWHNGREAVAMLHAVISWRLPFLAGWRMAHGSTYRPAPRTRSPGATADFDRGW